MSASPRRTAAPPDGAFRAEAAKALGNIGTQSTAVLPELLRLLQHDTDEVRAEAARALGKIGEGAGTASRALAAVLGVPRAGDTLRGVAAWTLGRVSPLASARAPPRHSPRRQVTGAGASASARRRRYGRSPPRTAGRTRPGFKQQRRNGRLVEAGERFDDGYLIRSLVARLGDPEVCHAAAQALYRIGSPAPRAGEGSAGTDHGTAGPVFLAGGGSQARAGGNDAQFVGPGGWRFEGGP